MIFIIKIFFLSSYNRVKMKTKKIPLRYLPKKLTLRDKKKTNKHVKKIKKIIQKGTILYQKKCKIIQVKNIKSYCNCKKNV